MGFHQPFYGDFFHDEFMGHLTVCFTQKHHVSQGIHLHTGHGIHGYVFDDQMVCHSVCDVHLNLANSMSMGGLNGKSTGNHRFSHEICFPVIFALNQSIDVQELRT